MGNLQGKPNTEMNKMETDIKLSNKYGAYTEINIDDNTFAAACYDQKSIEDLIEALSMKRADKSECKNWNLTPTEWRAEIELALKAKINTLRSELYPAEFTSADVFADDENVTLVDEGFFIGGRFYSTLVREFCDCSSRIQHEAHLQEIIPIQMQNETN
jgi:hypothetical protein